VGPADYVRTGKVRIVFRGLAFLGPDSRLALETAVAARQEHKLWDVVHALYLNQGTENSGWVTDTLLARIAAESGLDGGALAAARSRPRVALEIDRSARAATAAGVQGTPSFELGPTGGKLRLVELSSLGPDGLVPAIEAVLRRD
jgi:protein-disulfide isomerase